MDGEVFTWVQQRFSEVLEIGEDEIQVDSRFGDDLDADSIDLIEVVNGAEKQYGVTVEEQDLYDLETVGQLVELIERVRAGG